MGAMESEQSKYKGDASELHSLRAEVHSLSDILTRKEHAINESLCRSARAGSEIKDLQSRVCDLRQTNSEFKLFAEMHKRESTDSRDVLECKDREYYEWARVQSLKSSLDESRLEQRVKAANEAEAMSQQRLASAGAEIAELRHKMESYRRDIGCLSELLKSKHEEGEAYLSEIESIGQAYEDIQTQNQQLLQQIIERDDHNTKGEAQQLRQLMDQIQAKVGRSRLEVVELLIELAKERFTKRRIEDDLELMSRNASSLRAKTEGSAVLEKLHQEVKEYRGILKCGVCGDGQKEGVIAKCYHLFCNECIQKSLRNRQRRCPCGLSFGANDVKPIYI